MRHTSDLGRLVQIGMAAKEVYPDALPHWEEEGRIEPAEHTAGGRGHYDPSRSYTNSLHTLHQNDTRVSAVLHRRAKGRARVPSRVSPILLRLERLDLRGDLGCCIGAQLPQGRAAHSHKQDLFGWDRQTRRQSQRPSVAFRFRARLCAM